MPLFSLAAAIFVCTSPIVVDGDTLRCEGVGRVRLLAIDAPELPGHCRPGRRCVEGDGDASSAHLSQLIKGRKVICNTNGRDYYRRPLAHCSADGEDLSCAQVRDGQAVERYGRLECN